MVSSHAIDDGERLLLFDPLAVPDELMSQAAERKPMVGLTAPWLATHGMPTDKAALERALGKPRPIIFDLTWPIQPTDFPAE